MPIPLVSSLRASFLGRYQTVLRSGDRVRLGYSLFPKVIADPGAVSYRTFNGSLAVLSESADEIALVDPNNRRVFNRLANAGNPVAPAEYFPEIDAVIYRGNGGVDSDGVYLLDKNDGRQTLADIADGTVDEIADAVYSPLDRAVYLLDQGRSSLHRVTAEGILEADIALFHQATDSIRQATFDPAHNIIYFADAGNSAIQYVETPSSPATGSISLPSEPYGAVWSEPDQTLYSIGLIASQLKLFQWQSGTLSEISASIPDFEGTAVGMGYDAVQRLPYAKMASGLLGRDSLVYLRQGSGETVQDNTVFAPLDNPETETVPDRASLYATDVANNTVRAYQARQTVVARKATGTKADILVALHFTDNEGLIAISGLIATIYNASFGIRKVAFSLLDAYSTYLTSGDSTVSAQWFDNDGEQFLLLGFDNSTVLAVNANFGIIAQVPVEGIALTVDGSDKLINPSSNGPYRPVSFAYNEAFQYLYIGFANGTVDSSSHQSGTVVVYDLSSGIANASPVAYSEMPKAVGELRSVATNAVANHLHVLGTASGGSILRSYDLVPDGATLTLLSSKTSVADPSNLTVFNNRIGFVSRSESNFRSLGTSLIAEFAGLALAGTLIAVDASDKHGFLYVLDEQGRVFSLNEKLAPYGATYLPDTAKALAYFRDYLYVVYQGTEVSFPELSQTIPQGQATNQLNFASGIDTAVNVGDVITVSQSETYYLVSLSQAFPSDTKLYVDTFTPTSDLNPSTTAISLSGDRIAQINQAPIQRQTGGEATTVATEFTLGAPFDRYYSLSLSPYLLTNSETGPIFQTVSGELPVLGDRISASPERPAFQDGVYLYFQDGNANLYRLHLLRRWVQPLTLSGGPSLDGLRVFLEVSDTIYATFSNDSNLYAYSLNSNSSTGRGYSLQESLDLGAIPVSLNYSNVEGLLRIRTNDFRLIQVQL